MAAKGLTNFWRVRAVLSLFVQMGCELHDAEGGVVSPGGDIFNFRYLVNPETRAFVPVLDLGDEEFVSEGEVEFWERRLGLVIPKPPPHRRGF